MSRAPRPRLIEPVVDLAVRAFVHDHNGIFVVGTWMTDPDTRQTEPCLALVDGLRRWHRHRVVPCLIPLSSAWRWALHDGVGDPIGIQRFVDEAMRDGVLPGTPGNPADRLRVLNAVDSRLSDLLAMPPFPPARDRVVVADVTVRNLTRGTTTEAEITRDV